MSPGPLWSRGAAHATAHSLQQGFRGCGSLQVNQAPLPQTLTLTSQNNILNPMYSPSPGPDGMETSHKHECKVKDKGQEWTWLENTGAPMTAKLLYILRFFSQGDWSYSLNPPNFIEVLRPICLNMLYDRVINTYAHETNSSEQI